MLKSPSIIREYHPQESLRATNLILPQSYLVVLEVDQINYKMDLQRVGTSTECDSKELLILRDGKGVNLQNQQ